MKTIFGIRNLSKNKRIVLAIGVFDGLHYAHRKILCEVVSLAKSINGLSAVLTFSPHPQKEETLYSLGHRLNLLEGIGVDICMVVNFNENFAKIKADDFITNIVSEKIHPDYIFVGRNFRFGKDAKGDVSLLQKFSTGHKFKLKVFNVIRLMNKPVSSTYIRNLIKQGELNSAQKLLAHRVSVLGTVVKGSSLARRLGFPTANIKAHHEIIPPSGVYLVQVRLNKKVLSGLCYIGSRPTFKNKKSGPVNPKIAQEKNIEVYIFNFNRDIYGCELEIQFIRKIRNEKKFKSPGFLVAQIKNDLVKAKKLLLPHRK